MEDRQTAETKPQGITGDDRNEREIANARASLALGLLMTETMVNQQGVTDTANTIMDLLEKALGNPTITVLAALFSIAMTQAPDFVTDDVLAMAEEAEAADQSTAGTVSTLDSL